jgi:hypothetical protein
MACDKPTGDCTNVSPCGAGCSGCGGSTTPAPVLPKCQDVALTPGVFTHATVTVNAQGCISAVAKGEPELYTPDECCGGESTGTGTPGGRGPKGDPGIAATVAVIPQVTVGTSTVWSVENVGTPNAAIFKFTSPAPVSTGTTPSGATGQVCDFKVANGLVTQMPSALVTDISAQGIGVKAGLFTIGAAPDINIACKTNITLNLDAFHNDITTSFNEDIGILQAQINSAATGSVGVNGNLAWNGTSAAVSLQVLKADSTVVATVPVNPNGYATLPTGGGSTPLFVFLNSVLVGVYPG